MDDQLKGKLAAMVDVMGQKLKAGGEFVSEETPLLVQEWLAWTFWKCTLSAGVYLLVLIAVAFVIRWGARLFRRAAEDRDEDGKLGACAVMAIAGAVAAFCLIGFLWDGAAAVKVLVAPRVVVVEKVAELVSSKK